MDRDITRKEILRRLFELQDKEYREFQLKLMPGVEADAVIGVRTPLLRGLAKELVKQYGEEKLLEAIGKYYYDERNLYGLVLMGVKDYDRCVAFIDAFLPCVDNWATCDLLSPKVFGKKAVRERLLGDIRRWIAAEAPFTKRFGMAMLMRHYLDEDFEPEYLRWVASVRSEHYYVRMMQAWYFATALAKQWDATLPVLQRNELDVWTHNKTIQKAIESYRITAWQKALLRELRVKK